MGLVRNGRKGMGHGGQLCSKLGIRYQLWGGPQVRAGPPDPRFAKAINSSNRRKPTRASAADQGVRPTIKIKEH